MKFIMGILKFNVRILMSLKYAFIALALLAIVLVFLQFKITDYKESLHQKETFQQFETKKVEQFFSYRVYGTYGFRVLFLPAPTSILFSSSTALNDMLSFIDSSERLNIYRPLKSKNIFEFNQNWFADYAGFLFIFGSLIVLLYGYMAFSNTEYQRILASFIGKRRLFLGTCVARAIAIALFFLFFIAAAIIFVAINGINININIDHYLLIFYIGIYIVSLVFFSLGVLFGTYKSKIVGLIGGITSWFLLLFITTSLVGIIVSAKAEFIKPDYKLEMEKLKLMTDFEKRAIEMAGLLEMTKKPTDIDRELVLSYYKNEFQKIMALEEEFKMQLKNHINLFYKLSSFFPTASYLALTNELSSKGYKTLLAHYEEVKRIKDAFLKKYLEKVYFSEDSKVEPFLKGDANVLTAKPALPDYFLEGILFDLLWIAALLIPSYFRFKKNLFELPENKKDAIKHYDVVLQSKSFKSWNIFGALFFKQMYNILSNEMAELKKKGYDLDVYLDGQELNRVNKKQNFFALCHPTQIPGYFNVIHFIEMNMDLLNVDKAKRKEIQTRYSLTSFRGKCFSQLDLNELGQVFLAILDMKIFDIYLLNDIARDMPADFCIALKDRMDALCESGALVLFLYSSTEYLVFKNRKPSKYFAELYHWYNVVEDLKARNDDETTEC